MYLGADAAKLPDAVLFGRSVRSRIYGVLLRVGYEKLNSGVKTFAGLGCATLELASVSALPCSASRDCEWQICLRYSDVQEKNNRHSSSLFLFYTFLWLLYPTTSCAELFV